MYKPTKNEYKPRAYIRRFTVVLYVLSQGPRGPPGYRGNRGHEGLKVNKSQPMYSIPLDTPCVI